MLIRHYLGREPPDDLDDFQLALAEVELIREARVNDYARAIAQAFGEGK